MVVLERAEEELLVIGKRKARLNVLNIVILPQITSRFMGSEEKEKRLAFLFPPTLDFRFSFRISFTSFLGNKNHANQSLIFGT